MYATPADVDTVLVAGKVLKRGGKLQGVRLRRIDAGSRGQRRLSLFPIKDGPPTCFLCASGLVPADANAVSGAAVRCG